MERTKAIEIMRNVLLAEKPGPSAMAPDLFSFVLDLSGITPKADYPIRTAKGPVLPPPSDDVKGDPTQWCFFVDDLPTANWEHPCRYAFIRSVSAAVAFVPHTLPPDVSTNLPIEKIDVGAPA